MATMTRRKNSADGEIELSGQTIGNALVIHRTGSMSESAQTLALAVAEDTNHDLVVVDLPPGLPVTVWETVASLLPKARRRGIRLVINGRSRETTALAGQLLSERLGRPVIAPDGVVIAASRGSLFVDSGRGTGWVRFERGRPPRREAKRFPQPHWDSIITSELASTSSRGVAEPLPAGMWIRSVGFDRQQQGHRARLIATLPPQPDVLTVVLGSPGDSPVSLDDVARLWMSMTDLVRLNTRFVRFGPVATPAASTPGQALSDLLGREVSFYTGLPVASGDALGVVTVRPDGGPGWHPFVHELRHSPTKPGNPAQVPQLVSYQAPVGGLQEIAPALYWYAPDAVVEVVQSGLLIRSPMDSAIAAQLRATTMDNAVLNVTFEGTGEVGARMRGLAQDMLSRLDPSAQRVGRLLPASALLAERSRVRVAGKALAEIDTGLPASTMAPANHPAESSARAQQDAKSSVGGYRSGDPAPSFVGPVDLVVERAPLHEEPATSWIQPPTRSGIDVTESATVKLRTVAPSQPTAQRLPTVAVSAVVPTTLAPLPRALTSLPQPEQPRPHINSSSIRLESPSMPENGAEHDSSAQVEQRVIADPRESVVEATVDVADAEVETPDVTPESHLQPTPQAEASALLPVRGMDDERAWLRKSLAHEYGVMSNSVARILSEHPGFQGELSRSSAEVLTDAVAVQLYLSPKGTAIDVALRSATVGAHVPLARCVVAGLSRLPSHRGPAMFAATPTSSQWMLYRENRVVTEWGFLNALTGPCSNLQGDTDVLVWSMSARRTKLLERDTSGTEDRVLFVPGTSFKVLELTEPNTHSRGQILLRELTASEISETGELDPSHESLDDLALASLRREIEKWVDAEPRQRVGRGETSRFGALPGLT